MHERSLARALLTKVAEAARSFASSRVDVIRISIGRFSGVEPDLLQSAFAELLSDSPYPAAKMEMSIVEIEAKCPDCQHQFLVEAFSFNCPRCGCRRTSVVRGEEMMLESLVLTEVATCTTPM